MSKASPQIFFSPNPVNIDAVISYLQTIISMATFINEDAIEENYFDQGLILPLAIKNLEDNKPIVYWRDNEYYPAQPNDNYRAVSFFYQEDASAFQSSNNILYTINLVVWFNQDKYTRNRNYLIREYFITELVELIRPELDLDNVSTIEIFREIENIFSEYEIDISSIKYPYQAFRIRFSIYREFDCGIKLDLT